MLSKKLTFSLVFVTVLALGFAFAPLAMAAVGTVPAPDLSITDVSSANGNQLEIFKAINVPITNISKVATQADVDDLIDRDSPSGDIKFYIRLKKGYASLNQTGPNAKSLADADLHISDLSVTFYDTNGIPLTQAIDNSGSKITHRNTAFPDGRNFLVTIAEANIAKNASFMTAILPEDEDAVIDTSFRHADPVDVRQALIDNVELMWNAESNTLRLELVPAEPEEGDPDVVSMVRVVSTASRADQGASSLFGGNPVDGPFDVKVTFTEEPLLAMDSNNIEIGDLPFELENAKITRIVKGASFYMRPDSSEGNYSNDNLPKEPPTATGRDGKYHPYLLTITPNLTSADDVVIRVKPFNDLVKPPNTFRPPSNLASALNRSVLRVRVHPGAVKDIAKSNRDALATVSAGGSGVFLPGGTVIPAEGYLVLVRGTEADSGVRNVGANKYKDNDDRARGDNLTDIDFKYNVLHEFAFPAAASDFANFFRNGGTIKLGYTDIADASVSKNKLTGYHGSRKDMDLAALTPPQTIGAGVVVINEIMSGRDGSLLNPENAQWIELYNTTQADISIDVNEWALTFSGTVFGTEIDSVSNLSPAWWMVPSENGNTNPGSGEVFINLVSASRVDASTSGSVEANWVASERVGTNLTFGHIGTPGVANVFTPTPEEPVPVPVPEPTAPVATAADLRITEIMVASNEGRLPQWIEITNVSTREVSLIGWVLGIDNDDDDAEVVAPSFGIKLDSVTLDAEQSALVVSKLTNRNSGVAARSKADDNAGSLDSNRIVDAQSQVKPPTATYSLLSEMAVRLSLEPPLPLAGGVTDRGDVVGNLGGNWELPMSEDGRSSLSRLEMDGATEIMGTDAAGWVLASDTSLNRASGAYVATYYGDKDDAGTPGYHAGGALPVELSKFSAARDRVTGQVAITWETQSELNNAGFFIKRSQQKTGQFTVVNATMIAGAGTTSEKQAYTYTDTTAKPNIVYYYQIEDVSLDGNRQTLTRAHRLKGHIGAAGKLTTLWGELKNDQ